MRVSSPPGHTRIPVAFALAALALAACDRAPSTQPTVGEDVPVALSTHGGPPAGVAVVRVSLLTSTVSGTAVSGTWVVTFISADDGDNSVSAMYDGTPGFVDLSIPTPEAGCIVARPVATELGGSVPTYIPPPDPLTVGDPAADRAAVVTWRDADGNLVSAPAWRPFLLDACRTSPALDLARNAGNGPDPDLVIDLVPPTGTELTVEFLAPGANSTTTGEELNPAGYLIVPMCDGVGGVINQVRDWRPSGLDDDQHVGVVIGANVVTPTVPLLVPNNDANLPVPGVNPDPCNLPTFVVEQELVQQLGTNAFFTSTLELFGHPGDGTFPDCPIQDEFGNCLSPAEYAICQAQGLFESSEDGDPTKVQFAGFGNENEIKFGFQVHLEDQSGTGGNPQAVVFNAPPGVAFWWKHIGSGDATLALRDRTSGGTNSLNLPYSCPANGDPCTAGSASGGLGSQPGFGTVLSSQLLVDESTPERKVWKVLVSATGFASTSIEASLSTAGDGWPDPSKAPKGKAVKSAFAEISPPNESSCAFETNDDRWFSR